jgi:hypothetical protein
MFIPVWLLVVIAAWGLLSAISSNASSNTPLTPEQQREDDNMYLRYGVTPPRWLPVETSPPSKPLFPPLDKVAAKKTAKVLGIGAVAVLSLASLVFYIGMVKYWW